MAADLALSVDDLFVREHGAELGAPVDRDLGLEREAALETATRKIHCVKRRYSGSVVSTSRDQS